MRRTYVTKADNLGLEGELLVTVYEEEGAVTVAYRGSSDRTWGPPMIATERP